MNDRPDIGRIRTRARELSKSLLGAQFRAEVAAFVAVGEGPFWAREMSARLDIPENKISAELSRFASNNLLVAINAAAWDRRKLYERAPGSESYWSSALDLVKTAAKEEALRTGSQTADVVELYRRSVHGMADGGGRGDIAHRG